MNSRRLINKIFKRSFDIVIASILLIIILVPCFLVSLLILFYDGKPILFTQARPGKDNKIFKLYKFRTMSIDANQFFARETLKSDEQRISRLGQFLRKTSIDELPSLINVIKGDMSLVGPRPLLVHYLELYDDFQARRHEIRPGITGWAQVNGRNNISWEEKFVLDVWYVDNNTILIDLKIILMTLINVLKRKDITDMETASSKPFTGNRN